jgi:hypothetical protein
MRSVYFPMHNVGVEPLLLSFEVETSVLLFSLTDPESTWLMSKGIFAKTSKSQRIGRGRAMASRSRAPKRGQARTSATALTSKCQFRSSPAVGASS